MIPKFQKRGDIASIIYVIMFLVIIGIVIFLMSDLNIRIFSELETVLNESTYKDTEAHIATTDFKETYQSRLWDYGFLGIFFGSLIAIGISAYSTRISPIFYWVYGLLSLIVLTLGVVLSNIWQGLVAEAEFATTLTYFPIMNTLLGTYYPVVTTAVIIIAMVILFGKPPGQQEGYI